MRSALAGNSRERQRAGDDYAARVFVVFETSVLPLRTRAINYVWAATEKTGTMFASPCTKNVGIVVLRSGDTEAAQWRAASRDVLADYRAFFGEPPSRISAGLWNKLMVKILPSVAMSPPMFLRRLAVGRSAFQFTAGLRRRLALAVALVAVPAHAAGAFDQTHDRFARVLNAVVKEARVDYAKLKAAPAELEAYLKDVAAVPAAEFALWSEADRLALLLNLYNAQTLRLIVDHYPLKSIRSIGSLPGAAWRELIVRQGGQIMTLSHLENKIIRVDYREPRIHFALVCAAVGCPPLRSEPYVGARLNEQLDDQARQFLATAEKNRFDPAATTLHLSPIFKWYEGDFIKPAGSLAAYVTPFLPEAQRKALADPATVKVRFTDYDWALNELPQR